MNVTDIPLIIGPTSTALHLNQENDMQQPWINTQLYSPIELVLFAIGCGMWVIVYVLYAKHITKHMMIGMPVFAAASNFGWEFVWGFLPPYTDMGLLFLWGYRIWFFFDLYIFYGVIRYGAEQVASRDLKRYFKPAIVGVAVLWGFAYWFFKAQGYDTPIGANSAYIAQILISVLYLLLILRHRKFVWSSAPITWLRSLGTGFISLFMFMHYPENRLLLLLCLLSAIIDGVYLYLFHRRTTRDGAIVTGD
jgi:hypothetical protein